MDLMQIALIVLIAAGVWAVIELALVLRRARGVVGGVDQTVRELNNTIEEARPVVAKLDGIVDELQPAAAQIEPLLKEATVAVEALSADLVEVNGVLRDVAAVSGTASAASNAVSGIADAASEKVHKLFGLGRHAAQADRALEGTEPEVQQQVQEASEDLADTGEEREPKQYYTYEGAKESDHE